MDPTANVTEQRQIQYRVNSGEALAGDLERLAALAEALDEWLTCGGFLPAQWMRR